MYCHATPKALYHFPEKLIPLTILNILKGRSLPIYGDVAIDRIGCMSIDHCRAIERILRDGEARRGL
jgi:dTDP-glucose 4,6-dehydratase